MLAPGNDQQLVQRALGGSERSWLALIRRYEKRIYNHALRITGNPDDAMDILQDVMMSAYRNLQSYRGEGSFAAWLFRIASFRSMDYLRRRRVTAHDAVDELPDQSSHSPDSLLGKAEDNEGIMKLMALLTMEQRQVVELKFFQHFTFDEIGGQLGISSNTAKSRLYSALSRMRDNAPSNHVFQEAGP